MAYGHAERNLALIRQLEAETEELLGSLPQLDREQSAWLRETDILNTLAAAPATMPGVDFDKRPP